MATSPLAMTGQSNAVPSPIGGLNTRDSVDLLPETDAIRLDNFFPARSHVLFFFSHFRIFVQLVYLRCFLVIVLIAFFLLLVQ